MIISDLPPGDRPTGTPWHTVRARIPAVFSPQAAARNLASVPAAGTKWTGPEQLGFKVRFSSTTMGSHTATVRFRVSHGYYDTHFTAAVE